MHEGKVVLDNGLAFFTTKLPIKDEASAWDKEANTGPTAPRTPHQLTCFGWHKSQLARARVGLT